MFGIGGPIVFHVLCCWLRGGTASDVTTVCVSTAEVAPMGLHRQPPELKNNLVVRRTAIVRNEWWGERACQKRVDPTTCLSFFNMPPINNKTKSCTVASKGRGDPTLRPRIVILDHAENMARITITSQ